MTELLDGFDPLTPVEEAATPPASWYTSADFAGAERERVFRRAWQPVARLAALTEPGAYVSGELGVPWVVVRDAGGELRGFYNVCRHHAAEVVTGEGCAREFVCPYHGWTYGLDGGLGRAPRTAGIREFDPGATGLVPLPVATWGPYVLIRLGGPAPHPAEAWPEVTERLGPIASLRFAQRRTYEIPCNWKVYVDNYLDGGYHVPVLHGGLSSGLDLEGYRTELFATSSLQTCPARPDLQPRLGAEALYAWVHPNLMLNRYGPILDTNLVIPLGPSRCRVVIDWFFEESSCDPRFIDESIEASEGVQREDEAICASVQRGLQSGAYDTGRYAPRVEQAAWHFHYLLHRDLREP